jgi:hypothetical protein
LCEKKNVSQQVGRDSLTGCEGIYSTPDINYKYRMCHLKRNPNCNGARKLTDAINIVVLFSISLSGNALLHISRIAENDFDAK